MITGRLANDSDGPAPARIDLATWTPAVSPAPAPVDAYEFFDDRTVPANVLVAEVHGVVAGWVKVRSPTPLLSQAHVLEIGGPLQVRLRLRRRIRREGAAVGSEPVKDGLHEPVRVGLVDVVSNRDRDDAAVRHGFGDVDQQVLR